ncbi:MAG: hypothetical protein ACR2OX_08750 [Methyloligellaceae bacterium]
MTSNRFVPAGMNATAFPEGARLNPRAAAQALQSLSPGQVPPRSRSQTMAENLMAVGERALAMNPIRLASAVQRRAMQPAMYGARAGEGVMPGSGDPVEIPVSPRNSRDPVPVPDPRELAFGQYEMPGQVRESYSAKDQSRLRPEPEATSLPERNPTLAASTGVTIARKGGTARMATPIEANQYLPDDDFWDRRKKDLDAIPIVREESNKNLGTSTEQAADDWIWTVENLGEARRLGANLKAGRAEQHVRGRQKHESHADAVDNYLFSRYGDWEREKVMRTLGRDPAGVLTDALYWYTKPQVLEILKTPFRLAGYDLDGYMAHRARAHFGKPPIHKDPEFVY